jgi:2-succinyl-5-enolpyruvyl-6-hydroxy-3-cyclohexene-1-carboxylate synthase
MGALVDGLAEAGLTDACVSPGMRSAPLVLALARRRGIRMHVILDERSSAFFALGLAKVTGRPAAVVTTSGTAVANLLPAAVEASQSGTPMVILSADRPPELRGTGANQTIEQPGLFGGYVRWALDADVPRGGDDESWRAVGGRAVVAALGSPGSTAGPVHLNLPFREPLLPTVGSAPTPARAPLRPVDRGVRPERAVPDPAAAEELVALIASTERGVILAGSLDPWLFQEELAAVEQLADVASWPLIAEPQSGLRRPPRALAAGVHLLQDTAFVDDHVPEVVVQLGAAPTTRAGQALASRARRLAVASPRPADPERRAEATWAADPCLLAAKAAGQLSRRGPGAWFDAWRTADAAVAAAVESALDATDEPFEGRLARDVAAALPPGATLFAGSSMPVRDLDTYMAPRAGIRVVGNRGASGIDGSASTVFGIAASGAPAFALVGDLALLHDASGLLWNAGSGLDAVFVVPNNRGGGIFDHMEVAAHPEHERLFVTPHDLDLSALASAARAGFARVERAGEVSSAIDDAARAGGVHVIEVPMDRAHGASVRAEVREAVRRALSP